MSSSMESDADFLLLSGIKHFCFCKRRWALVHIEQQWQENALTVSGHLIHERVHDENFTESRGSVLLSRGMPVRSQVLRITGECDLVELRHDENGIAIHGRSGTWRVFPVEYKHGQPDERGADEMQLCAQALCLEEMLVTDIPDGAIYYGKIRRRVPVAFTAELRRMTAEAIAEMHRLFARGHTPKAKWTKACKSCSLVEVCQPLLAKRTSASAYIRQMLEEDCP